MLSLERIHRALTAATNVWPPCIETDCEDAAPAAARSSSTASEMPRLLVPRINASDITAADFERDFVHANRPCVITHAWPPRSASVRSGADAAQDSEAQWWNDRLSSITTAVTVSVTPNGLADAVTRVSESHQHRNDVVANGAAAPVDTCEREPLPSQQRSSEMFLQPLYMSMPACEAWAHVRDGKSVLDGVPYVSFQNDSLRTQVPELQADVQRCFSRWASRAWNLDAMNLWMGDSRSVTSTHKDHYENLYAVLAGEKVFHLAPPCDCLYMYEREYPAGQWEHSAGRWRVCTDVCEGAPARTAWTPIDLAAPDLARYPLSRHIRVAEVRVGAGELLYLPALWYHRVTQRGACIAVNTWWDMSFTGPAYAFHRFCLEMGRAVACDAPDGAGDGST